MEEEEEEEEEGGGEREGKEMAEKKFTMFASEKEYTLILGIAEGKYVKEKLFTFIFLSLLSFSSLISLFPLDITYNESELAGNSPTSGYFFTPTPGVEGYTFYTKVCSPCNVQLD